MNDQRDDETLFIQTKLSNGFGCAACALFKLNMLGIDALKVVGRGYQAERKVFNVAFLKNCLNLLDRSSSEEGYIRQAKHLFHEHFRQSCNDSYCYYPHFKQNGKGNTYQ